LVILNSDKVIFHDRDFTVRIRRQWFKYKNMKGAKEKITMRFRGTSLALALSVAATTFISAAHASEADVAEFYDDRTIEVLIGYSAGGGYDAYGRTLARHLSKHIPGNPTVIAKNVPGAGSLVLMNQIANTLPRDGTVIGAVNSGIPFEPLFDNDQAKFDVNEVNWLGNLNIATTVGVAWHDSGIERWQDLKTEEMSVGATGAGSNTNTIPRVLAEVLDLKINVISGYPGSNDVVLAMERGEVDGMGSRFMSSLKASTPQWLEEDSKVNFLYQIGRERHPDLPDVPLAIEMAETETQRQALELLGARLVMGRPYVAPPGVPAERLAALRQALEDTAKDPEFLADAAKQSLAISYVDGQDMQDYFAEVYQYPDDIVQLVKKAME
jgi:tripartite-type tricarboxylate transporter receptor subunit TctC